MVEGTEGYLMPLQVLHKKILNVESKSTGAFEKEETKLFPLCLGVLLESSFLVDVQTLHNRLSFSVLGIYAMRKVF